MHSHVSRRVQAQLLLCALVSACRPADGSRPPLATPPPPSEPAPTAAPAVAPAAVSTCTETCRSAIADAQLALDRARALEGAEGARAGLATEAGRGFEQAWRLCQLEPPDGADRSCEGASTVVSSLLEAEGMTANLARQIFAHLVALDARWRQPDATADAANVNVALDRLATSAEDAARTPQATGGADPALALDAAVYARLALGAPDAANRDAALFRQRFAAQHPDLAPLAAASIANHYSRKHQGALAVASLPRSAAPTPSAPVRVQVMWLGARAHALLEAGNPIPAAREAEQAVTLWKSVQAPADEVGGMAPWPMAGRERVVDAVGAATFVLAERHALAASARKAPRYRGPATHAGVNDFLTHEVAAWALKQQEDIALATRGYQEISSIRPVGPARWIVAGHLRVGELNADLADQLTSIALPPPLAEDDAEREAFARATMTAASPVLTAARTAFQGCIDLAERSRLDDDAGTYCRGRLNGLPATN